MRALCRLMTRVACDESGATAVEYGLLCSLIFLAVVPVVQSVAGSTIDMYGLITGAM